MTRNTSLYAGVALLLIYMLFQACQSEQAIRTAQYTVNGQKLFTAHCQNCHGAKGEGLGKLYPSLTDSTFLIGHRKQLPCIVKNGGVEMPPNPQLTPIEVAYVLTYIGNSFGNEMGIFTLEEVQEALTTCD